MIEKNELEYLLFSVPEYVDYTGILEDVDREDISKERINKLIYIINHPSVFDFNNVFRAGVLLCHWGIDDGFEYISNLLIGQKFKMMRESFFDNGEYEFILSAIKMYMIYKIHTDDEKATRKKIYPCVKEIIRIAKIKFFSISSFYYLIFERYNEYIPLIEDYLAWIIQYPDKNYWNIHDASKLLIKVEPDFVKKLFSVNHKKFSDFDITE